jgi:hypothetical protein
MPDSSETIALRVTVIGGQRYADDFTVIWRGLSIGRIMKSSGVPSSRSAMVVGLQRLRQAVARRRQRDRH